MYNKPVAAAHLHMSRNDGICEVNRYGLHCCQRMYAGVYAYLRYHATATPRWLNDRRSCSPKLTGRKKDCLGITAYSNYSRRRS